MKVNVVMRPAYIYKFSHVYEVSNSQWTRVVTTARTLSIVRRDLCRERHYNSRIVVQSVSEVRKLRTIPGGFAYPYKDLSYLLTLKSKRNFCAQQTHIKE